MVRVALFCGLRIGEIQALRWRDYQPPALHVRQAMSMDGTVSTPKTAKGLRVVPLGPVVLARPAGAKADDLIFAARTNRYARRAIETAMDRAKIVGDGMGWHTLRRTYATMRAGTTGLSDAMGHAQASTTAIYIRPGFAEQERATERVAAWLMDDGEGHKPQ